MANAAADSLRMHYDWLQRARFYFWARQRRMVDRANLRRQHGQEIGVGDLIFVSAELIPDPLEAGLPEKLRSKFTGPHRVVDVQEGRVLVRVEGRSREVVKPVSPNDCFRFDPDVMDHEAWDEDLPSGAVEGTDGAEGADGTLNCMPTGAAQRQDAAAGPTALGEREGVESTESEAPKGLVHEVGGSCGTNTARLDTAEGVRDVDDGNEWLLRSLRGHKLLPRGWKRMRRMRDEPEGNDPEDRVFRSNNLLY